MNIPGTSNDRRLWREKTQGSASALGELGFIPLCLALTLEPDHWPPSSRILNTTLFESWEIIGPYASWWLFNGLLLILQVLHVIWSYLIARIAFKALIRGKVRIKGGFVLWGWVRRLVLLSRPSLSSLVSPSYAAFPAKSLGLQSFHFFYECECLAF